MVHRDWRRIIKDKGFTWKVKVHELAQDLSSRKPTRGRRQWTRNPSHKAVPVSFRNVLYPIRVADEGLSLTNTGHGDRSMGR